MFFTFDISGTDINISEFPVMLIPNESVGAYDISISVFNQTEADGNTLQNIIHVCCFF